MQQYKGQFRDVKSEEEIEFASKEMYANKNMHSSWEIMGRKKKWKLILLLFSLNVKTEICNKFLGNFVFAKW